MNQIIHLSKAKLLNTLPINDSLLLLSIWQ